MGITKDDNILTTDSEENKIKSVSPYHSISAQSTSAPGKVLKMSWLASDCNKPS